MRSVHLFLVLGIAVVGVAYSVFSPGPKHPGPTLVAIAKESDPTEGLVIGKPIVWLNLAILPVSSRSPRLSDRFITLDEGLRTGTVEILERGATSHGGQVPNDDPFGVPAAPSPSSSPEPLATPAPAATQPPASPTSNPFDTPVQQGSSRGTGNSVNELLVINHSEKPLYLMPGEIIIGGDQDRTIAEELVIAPGAKPTAIEVFCVEHGRWGGRSPEEYARIVEQAATSGETSALVVDRGAGGGSASDAQNLNLVVSASQIAERANSGKFIGSVGSLNKPLRLAVQGGEGQSKVWDEVANQNAKADVRATSGTFAGNYSETEAAERLAPFLRPFHGPISETPNVVGVIVAVNGEIESMDVFESTPLFKKLWPKLLKSYALDASNAVPAEGEVKTASAADASRFMRDVAGAKRKKDEAKGDLALSEGESDDVLVFSMHERRAQREAAAMGGFGGGMMGGGFFGGAVHSAGFSK